MPNPFVQIVNKLPNEPTLITIEYLEWVRDLFLEEKIDLNTYGNILSVLEYLHDNNALIFTFNTEDDTYSICKKEYN